MSQLTVTHPRLAPDTDIVFSIAIGWWDEFDPRSCDGDSKFVSGACRSFADRKERLHASARVERATVHPMCRRYSPFVNANLVLGTLRIVIVPAAFSPRRLEMPCRSTRRSAWQNLKDRNRCSRRRRRESGGRCGGPRVGVWNWSHRPI